MLLSRYRKRVATMAIELAKEDPTLVKEAISRLRETGEIEADDLLYLERLADRWIKIAQENRRSAHA